MHQSSILTVERNDHPRGTVLTMTGELDYDASPVLRRTFDQARLTTGQRLVLELSGVTFCDSSGVNLLVAARATACAQGAGIAVTGVTPAVAKVLRITGLDTVLPAYASPDEAFADAPATD
ncbi:STAS domain-containing protein [Streptomyces sp. T-3]|nr:STAS domain-containing protein [Streptomyces sp. T-3]